MPKNAIGRISEVSEDLFGFRLFEWVKELREKEYKERPERMFLAALSEIMEK